MNEYMQVKVFYGGVSLMFLLLFSYLFIIIYHTSSITTPYPNLILLLRILEFLILILFAIWFFWILQISYNNDIKLICGNKSTCS